MSRMTWMGWQLHELDIAELRQAHHDITMIANREGVADEQFQEYWGDDLDEIGAEILRREGKLN